MEKISESQAKEMYKDKIEEMKEQIISNYYFPDMMESFDSIGFNVGFQDFCGDELSQMGYELEE